MKAKLLTAEDYKASLPVRNNGGVSWTIETFSTYVNLLYPHITVAPGQEWTNNATKYKFVCSIHGPYESQANTVLFEGRGCRCQDCAIARCKDSAGTSRKTIASKKEKELAAKLHSEGISYCAIARQLGRSDSTIRRWIDPEAKEKMRKCNDKWRAKNREHICATSRRYNKEFDHGRANHKASNAHRRLLKLNTPEFVFFDDEWHEVDRRETYKVFKDYLLPPAERKAIQELYLEAQHQTETTGVEHHVDHIQPLSKGGEHRMFNLQILPANENLSKGDTFREEDQALIIQRLFN